MFPVQWSANVRLPYYGWFGQSGFSTERAARGWIAGQYRQALAMARAGTALVRPAYGARSYTVKVRPLTLADLD